MHGRPGQARGSDRAVTVVGTTVDHAVVQGRRGAGEPCVGLRRQGGFGAPCSHGSSSSHDICQRESLGRSRHASRSGRRAGFVVCGGQVLSNDIRCARRPVRAKQRAKAQRGQRRGFLDSIEHARPIRYVGGSSASFSTAAPRPRNIHRAERMCVQGLPGSERRRCGQRSKGSSRPLSRPCRSTSTTSQGALGLSVQPGVARQQPETTQAAEAACV